MAATGTRDRPRVFPDSTRPIQPDRFEYLGLMQSNGAPQGPLRIGIIGGSGLEDRLQAEGLLEDPRSVELETPFGRPSAPILVGSVPGSEGVEVAILRRHGAGHTIPPHRVPYRANVFALKLLGVTHVVATGAVGSLRRRIRPGELVLVDQFIDRTSGAGSRGAERTFYDAAAVHVEFADPCCPVVRSWLMRTAKRAEDALPRMHEEATYVAIDGPAFSTRAESGMHRSLGGDLVGMTALPEARLAREAEIAYALLALPTDDDCWRSRPASVDRTPESLLEEIIGNLHAAADAAARLLASALRDVSELRRRASPAHDALRLGIWTRPELIASEERARLAPLWGRRMPTS